MKAALTLIGKGIADGFCELFGILRRTWRRTFGPKPKRIALRLVSYSDADKYISEGWKLAKEEDTNRQIGFVYLEKLQP